MFNLILLLILAVAVFGIIIYITKSLIKAIILSYVIITIFKFAWLYTPEDIAENIMIKTLLPEDKIEVLVDKYSIYADKRDEISIFSREDIEESVDEIKNNIENQINENTGERVD